MGTCRSIQNPVEKHVSLLTHPSHFGTGTLSPSLCLEVDQKGLGIIAISNKPGFFLPVFLDSGLKSTNLRMALPVCFAWCSSGVCRCRPVWGFASTFPSAPFPSTAQRVLWRQVVFCSLGID